jgi:hypothetical protein
MVSRSPPRFPSADRLPSCGVDLRWMAWELIFMLLLLKIPLVYLCGVVWYAVKAEPVVDDAPGDSSAVREPWSPAPRLDGRRGSPSRIPRLGPDRRPSRSRVALAGVTERRR